jgi:hypothetical protein
MGTLAFQASSGIRASARVHYVRAGATGNGSGSDWTNACTDFTGSCAATALQRGDIYYVASGNYAPGSFSASASGSGVVTIQGATAANHGNEMGWQNTYSVDSHDGGSQAVFAPIQVGSNITLDGEAESGIKLALANPPPCTGSDPYCNNQAAVKISGENIALKHLDIAGPGGPEGFTSTGDLRGIDTTGGTTNGLHISHCRIHGFIDGIYFGNTRNSLIEHSQIYDIYAQNAAMFHDNVFASIGSSNITFRYNEIYHWESEGIMLIFSGVQAKWYIYGNVWHDSVPGSTGRVLETQNAVNGPIYFYNNTVVNAWGAILESMGGAYAAGSEAKNNIFWNVLSNDLTGFTRDYNLTSGPNTEPHGIGQGPDPFVNYAGKDYHIVSAVAAMYPSNRGVVLSREFNRDKDGNLRGADGLWDIGAYEAAVSPARHVPN